MGIVSSGVKALTKGGVRKAPKAAAKKAPKKPISQAQKDKWMIEGAILTPLVGAEAAILSTQKRQMEDKRAKRQTDLESARSKSGSRSIGADKFGWAGRR
jgi:hypothetical protein